MNYPSLPEVDAATHVQLARWYRFLKSPGMSTIGGDQDRFGDVMIAESDVMRRICYLLDQHGGITTTISKEIGW